MKLRAHFELDDQGKPRFIDGKHRHYYIKLSVDDVPVKAEAVTYKLHESYYDPVREVFRRDAGDQFEESITSYGDFVVTGHCAGHRDRAVKERLSSLLAETHGEAGNMNEHIHEAIEDIRNN